MVKQIGQGESARLFTERGVWQRRKAWIDFMITHQFPFRTSVSELRLLMNDAEFAQIVRIPAELVRTMRSNRAFLVAVPEGNRWVMTFTRSPDFGGSKYASILRRLLIRLAKDIARMINEGGDDVELLKLQQEALLIFDELPPGMQQELMHMAPWIVTSARQGQST